jgi:membrane-associated HD superfamily phosphohydrolase
MTGKSSGINPGNHSFFYNNSLDQVEKLPNFTIPSQVLKRLTPLKDPSDTFKASVEKLEQVHKNRAEISKASEQKFKEIRKKVLEVKNRREANWSERQATVEEKLRQKLISHYPLQSRYAPCWEYVDGGLVKKEISIPALRELLSERTANDCLRYLSKPPKGLSRGNHDVMESGESSKESKIPSFRVLARMADRGVLSEDLTRIEKLPIFDKILQRKQDIQKNSNDKQKKAEENRKATHAELVKRSKQKGERIAEIRAKKSVKEANIPWLGTVKNRVLQFLSKH